MEGSGLGTALETVYTFFTVSQTFSGKVYAWAVGGHLLCASAVQLILLKEFWDSLNSDQQNELKNIYESEDPSRFANDDISYFHPGDIRINTINKEGWKGSLSHP